MCLHIYEVPTAQYQRHTHKDNITLFPFAKSFGTRFDYTRIWSLRWKKNEKPFYYYQVKEENKGKEPPQFMSTHPSSSKRIKDLSEWENSVILDYPPITI